MRSIKAKHDEDWGVIQLYSPETYHDAQAIVLDIKGRERLIKTLQESLEDCSGRDIIMDAMTSDGEGYSLGIFVRKDALDVCKSFQDPYLHDWKDQSLPDPRQVTEMNEDKSCRTCERDQECAGNDSGKFPCPDYIETKNRGVNAE